MENISQWIAVITFIVGMVSNIGFIVWNWAKLDKAITVSDIKTAEKFKNMDEKLDNKFSNVQQQINEIKDNHLHEIKDEMKDIHKDIRDLDSKLNAHLQK